MGDTGSLTLGYILSFLAIKYSMYTGEETFQAEGAPIVIAFSILLVPCLDVIRVVIGRVRRHAHPFHPDKTHIHHKFMAMGFSPRKSLVLIQLISLTFISCTAILVYYFKTNINIIFAILVISWTILNLWLSKFVPPKKD